MTIHLSILHLLAARCWRSLAGLAPRGARRRSSGWSATLVPLGYAVTADRRLRHRRGAACSTSPTTRGSRSSGIRYKLGVDGLNLWLVVLTTLLFAASALWIALRPAGARRGCSRFHFGLAETAVLGAFLAQDLALFVLFFDLMLVPFYFLVGQWGGPDRVPAAMKMVIYTLVGSLLMLAGAVADRGAERAARAGTSASCSRDLRAQPAAATTRRSGSSSAFALAFLIKMPAFPFHGWMPDAYRNMPLPALAVFSGVVSKVAAYGFLRIVLPLFPAAAEDFQMIVLILALRLDPLRLDPGVHADRTRG